MIRTVRNMRIYLLVFLCWLCSLLFACATKADGIANSPIETDLYSILSSPNSYDGKLVQVSGFICLSTDNTALVFSYRYCDSSEGNVGIGLHLGSGVSKIREEYGHKTYGEVIGVVHTLEPNHVWVDNGLGSVWIDGGQLTSIDQPFVWSYDVVAPMNSRNAAYSKVVEITNKLLEATKNKDYLKLGRVFFPRNDEFMNAYAKDFDDASKRINWVFFSAPHSIYAQLNASGNSSETIEVYETAHSGEYLSCTTIGNQSESFQPGIDYLLRGGNKFCFRISDRGLISNTDFEND